MPRTVAGMLRTTNERSRFVEIGPDRWLPVRPVDPEPSQETLSRFVAKVQREENKEEILPDGSHQWFIYPAFATRFLIQEGLTI